MKFEDEGSQATLEAEEKFFVPQKEVEVEKGITIRYKHPQIVNGLPSIGVPKPEQSITMALAQDLAVEATFEDYLHELGVSYEEFEKIMAKAKDEKLSDVFEFIQRRTIIWRWRRAKELDEKFRRDNKSYENQQETTKAHGLVWRKIINDLGIDGLSAEEGTQTEDYLDKIDELIKIDPVAMETEGEEESVPFIIGVQRSFEPKADIPIQFIPERPEAGPVFTVILHEDPAKYDNLYDNLAEKRIEKIRKKAIDQGKSFTEYAEQEAAAKGLTFRQYMHTIDYGQVSSVLPEGVDGQYMWALEILHTAKDQLQTAIIKENNPFIKKRLEKTLGALEKTIEQVKSDVEMAA